MRSRQAVTSLLDADPEMGRLRGAHAELLVHVGALARGPRDVDRLSVEAGHLGLLAIEGVIAREALLADTISTEPLGEGRPGVPLARRIGSALLALEVRWTVLAEARIAARSRSRRAPGPLSSRIAAGCFPASRPTAVGRVGPRTASLRVGTHAL
jgi:hypothetical protein